MSYSLIIITLVFLVTFVMSRFWVWLSVCVFFFRLPPQYRAGPNGPYCNFLTSLEGSFTVRRSRQISCSGAQRPEQQQQQHQTVSGAGDGGGTLRGHGRVTQRVSVWIKVSTYTRLLRFHTCKFTTPARYDMSYSLCETRVTENSGGVFTLSRWWSLHCCLWLRERGREKRLKLKFVSLVNVPWRRVCAFSLFGNITWEFKHDVEQRHCFFFLRHFIYLLLNICTNYPQVRLRGAVAVNDAVGCKCVCTSCV